MGRFRGILLACAIIAAAVAEGAYAVDCSVKAEGATWDLSSLDRTLYTTDGDLECTSEVEQNYTYAFNLCGTAEKPRGCTGTGDVSVFQYDPERVGYCYTAGKITSMSLKTLDENNRAKGVKVTWATVASSTV